MTVIIVVAKSDKSWGDLAKTSKPGRKTAKIGFGIDAIERIDTIAGDENVVWVCFAGLSENGVQNVSREIRIEMNIGNEEELEAVFVLWAVIFITSVIETFH